MAHGTRISGTNKNVTAGFTRISGVNKKVKKGLTLVGGVQKDINFGPQGTPVWGLAVGESVYTPVNGILKEFIVVHQGKPSSMYDDSCNGTWLLMKDIYENRQWHSSNSNDYAASTIHSYLNSTLLKLLDTDVQSAVKQVKIPCASFDGIASGSNGLSTKVFLLGGYEIGYTTSTDSNTRYELPTDGACLNYFSGTGRVDSKRIAYLNGAAKNWWLRSMNYSYNQNSWYIDTSGKGAKNGNCTSSYGIRPAFILPPETLVDENFQIIA